MSTNHTTLAEIHSAQAELERRNTALVQQELELLEHALWGDQPLTDELRDYFEGQLDSILFWDMWVDPERATHLQQRVGTDRTAHELERRLPELVADLPDVRHVEGRYLPKLSR